MYNCRPDIQGTQHETCCIGPFSYNYQLEVQGGSRGATPPGAAEFLQFKGLKMP